MRLFLRTIGEAAPWFLDEGLLNIPQWDHLGEDLRKRKKEPLPVGTSAIWTLICRCLTNPRPTFKDMLEKGEDILEEIKEERSRTSERVSKRGSSSDEEELSE